MSYFMWRVLAGLHEEIKISFAVGHTKFAPGWCFGLFKRNYLLCKIDCLDDIIQAVSQSATLMLHSLLEHKMVTSLFQCTNGVAILMIILSKLL